MSIFPIKNDVSEESFIELFRQCDIDARSTVLVLMRALTNLTLLNWLHAGSAISDQVGRLDPAAEQTGTS